MTNVLKRLTALITVFALALWLCPARAEAKNTPKAEETQSVELVRWDFAHNVSNWYHWEANYNGAPVTISRSQERLQFFVDFSQDGESVGAQAALGFWHKGFAVPGANRMVIDLLYEKEQLNNSITIQATSEIGIDSSAVLSAGDGVDAGDGLARATVIIDFTPLADDGNMKDLTLHFFGNKTTYSGNIYIDTLSIWRSTGMEERPTSVLEKSYVNATVMPDAAASWLPEPDGGINPKSAEETTIRLVDPEADPSTQKTYLTLKTLGETGHVLFGQEENTWMKAGSQALNYGDTMDLVGSYAGVVGIDTQDLTTNYSIPQHNNRFGTNYRATVENRIAACAELCNWSIEQGALITLTAHTPNFTKIETTEDDTNAYDGYDFTLGATYDLENDPAKAILPGGAYHQTYSAYLEMIASFAKQVQGTILFRPLPENPGDWVWWGSSNCDAETYQKLYRYTVEQLRDVYQVHNLLYVYSPSGDFQSEKDYAARYPGDTYVDILGFGLYHRDGAEGDGWMDSLKSKLEILDTFAANHGKLSAVTETGFASSEPFNGCASAALQLTGNAYRDWYMDVLDAISDSHVSYLMMGKNSFRDGFQVPFIAFLNADGTARGHEMMDSFIRFFNDPRTVFACSQKALPKMALPEIQVLAAEEWGGVVNTVLSSDQINRLLKSAGAGQTVTLKPSGTGFHPAGSRLSVHAKDLALLAEKGASVKVDGPIAGIRLTNEGVRALGDMDGEISFTVQRTDDTIDVSVYANDTRLTYVPGGLTAEIYMDATPETKARLVTARTEFPYGNPLEALLGASEASAWTPDGTYTASLEVKDHQVTAWSITDQTGKVLLSGSGLGNGTVEIDGGKTFRYTPEDSTLHWSIEEDSGRTAFTGSSELNLESGQLPMLTEDTDPIEDGRYTATIDVRDGKIVSWSCQDALSGSGLSTSIEIDAPRTKASVNPKGTAVTVSLNGSAKVKIS